MATRRPRIPRRTVLLEAIIETLERDAGGRCRTDVTAQFFRDAENDIEVMPEGIVQFRAIGSQFDLLPSPS